MANDFTQSITKISAQASAAFGLEAARDVHRTPRDSYRANAIKAMVDAFGKLNEFRSDGSFEMYQAIKMACQTICLPLLQGLYGANNALILESIIRDRQLHEPASVQLFLECSELDDDSAYRSECLQSLERCDRTIRSLLESRADQERHEIYEKVLTITRCLEFFLDDFDNWKMHQTDSPER